VVEGGIRGAGWQLTVRGGRTRWRGAQGVVKSIEERLERVVHGCRRRAGRSGGDGPEGLLGLELDGSQRCTGVGWRSRRRRLGKVVDGGGTAR
jgi:hypothetical protein